MSGRAHPCVGGPLDGQYATDGDFHGYYEKVPGTRRNDYSKKIEGMYEHLKDEYYPYNCANRSWARHRMPNVVFVHKDLVGPSVPPSKR